MGVFSQRMTRLGTENAFKLGRDIQQVEAGGQDVIKLNLGEPDFHSAENINQAAIDEIQAGNSHYVDPRGLLPLRASIARHIEATRGIAVDPERVVVTSGGKPPIGYSILTYVDPGDEVIYPNPGFPIYESWIDLAHGVPRPLELREDKDFRFDASDLEPLVNARTKLLIINSPSNPTGGVLTREDLRQVAEIMQQKAHPDFRVLSDEVYEAIVFDGLSHESIVSEPGLADHTVIMNSHSKTFAMTGWRLGYAVLPRPEEADAFFQWNVNIYSCTPPFIQMAAKEALDNPENQGIVRSMRETFQQRRDAVIHALNRIEGVRCVRPKGAFYAFPNIAGVCERLGILEYCDGLRAHNQPVAQPSTLFQLFALYHHGVATLDRPAFGTRDIEGRHYLRISLASDLASLQEGVRRLEAAAGDAEGFAAFMRSRGAGFA